MTAEAFAEILSARSAGRGRWLAKCPSHSDRHPSLSITQGHSAILLRCWSAGCSTEQIVAALGLPMSALFDAPLTPATRHELEWRRAKRTLEASRQRRRRIALMKGYRACTSRMAEIADVFFNGVLPDMPEELGHEFHDCLDFQRAVEVEVFS